MSSQYRNSNFSTLLVLAVVFGLIASGAPSAVLAAPPFKKACTQADPFERLACRQGAIADQVGYTSDTAFAVGTKLHQHTNPARLAHIKNTKGIAQRATKKHTKETFMRQAKAEAQGNKKAGHLVPLTDLDDTIPAGGDGICDYEQGRMDAKCAAIELDASGNLQVCNPEKMNKGKGKGGRNPNLEGLECDLSYDSEEASTASEAVDMEEAGEQLDATYSATEDNLIEMNEHLDNVNETVPVGSAPVVTAANGCVVPTVDPKLTEAVPILRIVYATLFGVARQMADVGGQDFVIFGAGGNTRTIAIAFDTIAAVANLAYITVDEIHKTESGAVQGAIMDCVNQTAGEIASLKALIQIEHYQIKANDNTNRDTIMTKLEEVRAEVVNLLNTPLGQRPSFPQK